ncbi:dirigent protein 2-like [Cajanus cajan]|uniref:dirigent protein 2-like n=1 Tax=Cajanus cajan TaxID=3821 RepID=UPI0010FAFEC5|nr:dirigent protein 2-like [Cajanus cajan]
MSKSYRTKTRMMSILHITLTLTLLFSLLANAEAADEFYRDISPTSLGLHKEKLTHLRFYLHDILSGSKPTAVRIAQAQSTNTSSSLFGLLVMTDDPLTVGPEPDSKLVGKAQGMYGFSDQKEIGLSVIFNMAFTEEKYNGSTISLLGRNMVLSAVREIPIVGGSGAFRFARGYAEARSYTLDGQTGDAVVEYNLYVFHY